MKKIVAIILLTVVLLFVFTSPIIAQTLTVSPSTGDTATAFTATLLGFKPGYRHCIRGYLSGDVVWANCEIFTDNNGDLQTVIGPFTTEGNYTIRVTEGYDVEVGNTVEIEIFGQVSLQCGGYCPANSTECPRECPCVHQGGGIWQCETPPPTPTPTPGGIQPTVCKKDEPGEGIQTALGCIPTKDTTQFVAWLLEFVIGIGGGLAILLIIIGGIQVLTSAGNPERVKAGKELITSALTGLLFIIFSLFLLQLIGVKILQIPGFGTP